MHNRFDSLKKGILERALESAGIVRTQHEIRAAPQWGDVWFEPDPALAENLAGIGLLGRMAAEASLFEPFHGDPSTDEVRDCVRKLFALHHRRGLDADRKRSPKPSLPRLWVIANGGSSTLVRRFDMKPMEGWPAGFFATAEGFGLHVVALRLTPRTRSTLLLRLMGAGTILNEAIDEFVRLPKHAWEVRIAGHPLVAWGKKIPQHSLSKEEREVRMRLQPFYDQWERKVLEKGKKEGAAEMGTTMVLSILEARGIRVTKAVRERVLACTDAAELKELGRRAVVVKKASELFEDRDA